MVSFLGYSLGMLLLFVVVEMIADALALLREQRKVANPAQPTAPADTVSS